MRFVLVLVLSACAFSVAHADDVEAAKLHYKNGTKLYDLGRYVEAAKEYQLAFEAKDEPALLFNIAQAYRLAQDYPTAIRFYKSFLRRVPNSSSRADVEQRIHELEKAIEQQARAKEGPPEGTMQPGQMIHQAPAVVQPQPISKPQEATAPSATAAIPATSAVSVSQAAQPTATKPLYKRAWFWGVIGGAVVAVAVGVGLGVGLSGSTAYPTKDTTFGTVRW